MSNNGIENRIIHPVILCGGSGTRLWPVSRKSYPKQFVKLLGDQSPFQACARRLSGQKFASPCVITGSDFRFMVIEQLAAVEIASADILIEPSSRNTAAAICAAAISIHEKNGDSLMLVAPSDHVIPDFEGFQSTVFGAISNALEGEIVTFGIQPDRPETGYGWLEMSTKPLKTFTPTPQPLASFVEKPDKDLAQKLFAGGKHLWNAGIFLFSTETILRAFENYSPEILSHVRLALASSTVDLGFTRLSEEPWSRLKDISIDYAVMEKAENMSVMPYAGSWSDLGDWDAFWREGNPDVNGVVATGNATSVACKDTLLYSTDEQQKLVGVGLEGVIAVSMPDAVLVVNKDQAQRVKSLVAELKDEGAWQSESFLRDFRPWGWYQSIATGARFQVKRIVVNPGGILSLQSHKCRSEHWIVVEGQAKVTIGLDVKRVSENESVYIPVGSKHRLENPGTSPLTLIEVQTGTYFGEDDIIRYEDVYARGQGARG